MLRVGLLWFDDTPKRPLSEKIEHAASHYENKYGRSPNVCYLNSSALTSQVSSNLPIRIIGIQEILPFHFWVGVSDFESDLGN